MSCPELDFWGPIPAGSQFCAKVTATNADFLTNIRIVTANGMVATMGTTALLNGPLCALLENRGHSVTAKIRVDDEAPTVVLDMKIIDANGTTLFSSQCQFSQPGKFEITRVLVAA